jgi:hypothetical protein
MDGGDRLDRILAALPPDDAAWLAARLEPPWRVRQRRLGQRDEAVRAYAAAACVGLPPTAAAKAVAAALERYLGTAWPRERELADLPDAPASRSALHRLARLNDGGPIGWRQLLNIVTGTRGR